MADQTFLKEDLIALRESLGLTQQQMADQLDMALRSYQAIEAGESSYRYIHRLAVERVALMLAADRVEPMLAPPAVRQDAIDIVWTGELIGQPEFQKPQKKSRHAKDAKFRATYSTVGELVLIANALDHQLNHVLIQVLHLIQSPMLESVVATLDVTRKLEMLRMRTKHISQQNWRKPVMGYLEKVETIWRWRNIACHTPLIPDHEHDAVFAPAAASKLLKSLTLGKRPRVERIPIRKLDEIVKLAERTLAEGQKLIENFQRLNARRNPVASTG